MKRNDSVVAQYIARKPTNRFTDATVYVDVKNLEFSQVTEMYIYFAQ